MGNINPFKGLEELVCQAQRTQEPIKGNSIDNIAPIVERVIQQSKAFRLNSNLFRSYDPLGKFLPENVYVEKFNEAVPLANYRSSPIHATFLVTPKNGGSPVVMSFGNTPWYGNITITRYNSENNSFETRVAVVPHDVTWPSGDLSKNIRKMIEALNKAGYEVEQIPLSDFDKMIRHPSDYPNYQNPLINPNSQKKSQSSTPITTISKEEGIEKEEVELG
jgi:hypothetical protein